MRVGSVLNLLLFVGWLGSQTLAWGQSVLRVVDPTFWDGSNLVSIRRTYSDACGVVRDPSGAVVQQVNRPTKGVGEWSVVDYHDGTFYACCKKMPERDEDGKLTTTVTMKRFSDGAWETMATGVFPAPGPITVFHLKNGDYLAVTASANPFESSGMSYPLAILRADEKGKLQVRSVDDFGFEKMFFKRNKQVYFGQLVMGLLGMNFTRAKDRIVLDTTFGYFFIFDAEDGTLKRTAKLYSGVTEQHLTGAGDAPLMPGTLGFATRPDGHVLVSCRSEDAVLNAFLGAKWERGSTPEQTRTWANTVSARYPVIEWWDLDPETGKFTQEPPPMDFPERLESEDSLNNFNWRFKPNGDLHLFGFKERYNLSDAVPPAKKKPAGAESSAPAKAAIPNAQPETPVVSGPKK